jgi:ssDNA-binding Zn-finger/Zn-ribbon topoisomerase 1
MVERSRRADGNKFWGCPTYPKCDGTRNARPGDFVEQPHTESKEELMEENNGNYNPNAGNPGKPAPQLDAPGIATKMLDAFKEGAGEVGSIMLEKGKRKSAALVAGEIVGIARKAAGEHWPRWLEGPKAQRAAMFLIPFNAGMLIKVFAPNSNAAKVAIEACNYAYKGVAEEVADDVAEYVVPMVAEIAKLGAGLGYGLVANQLQGGEVPKIEAEVESIDDD